MSPLHAITGGPDPLPTRLSTAIMEGAPADHAAIPAVSNAETTRLLATGHRETFPMNLALAGLRQAPQCVQEHPVDDRRRKQRSRCKPSTPECACQLQVNVVTLRSGLLACGGLPAARPTRRAN